MSCSDSGSGPYSTVLEDRGTEREDDALTSVSSGPTLKLACSSIPLTFATLLEHSDAIAAMDAGYACRPVIRLLHLDFRGWHIGLQIHGRSNVLGNHRRFRVVV